MPAKDPTQRRATVRAWYHRTKHLRAEAQPAQRRARKELRKRTIGAWYVELKTVLVCQSCGENHPACLAFHHEDAATKERNIADAVRRGWGRDRILRELAKCRVLCANCHAKHHANSDVP